MKKIFTLFLIIYSFTIFHKTNIRSILYSSMNPNKFNFMKYLLTILSLFVFSLFYSQKYHFNYYTLYKREIKHKKDSEIYKHERVINNLTNNYNLTFDVKSKSRATARIMDFKNSIQHFFKMKSVDFPLKSENFEYQYSIKMPDYKKQIDDEFSRRFFKSELLEEMQDYTKYSIQECKNENLTNCRSKAEVLFQPFKDDLATDGLVFLFDYHDMIRKLKFPKNYILKSANKEFEGKIHTLELEAVEELNLDLDVIPGKIKLR